jgi:hypothetical protein
MKTGHEPLRQIFLFKQGIVDDGLTYGVKGSSILSLRYILSINACPYTSVSVTVHYDGTS